MCCTCSDLSATVLKLCEQIKTVANSYCWFARKKTNSHQSKTDPCQPILARLTVCVKECFDTLEQKHNFLKLSLKMRKYHSQVYVPCKYLWRGSESIGTSFICIVH